MDMADIPLFGMLRSRLGYLSEQQKVLAQNIANADTAGFTPQDLKPFSFDATMQAQQAQAQSAGVMATTEPGHISPPDERQSLGSRFKAVNAPDSETTLNGNSVVLEEEMIKMSDARMNYDAAITFYQKSLALLKLATRKPGSGA